MYLSFSLSRVVAFLWSICYPCKIYQAVNFTARFTVLLPRYPWLSFFARTSARLTLLSWLPRLSFLVFACAPVLFIDPRVGAMTIPYECVRGAGRPEGHGAFGGANAIALHFEFMLQQLYPSITISMIAFRARILIWPRKRNIAHVYTIFEWCRCRLLFVIVGYAYDCVRVWVSVAGRTCTVAR